MTDFAAEVIGYMNTSKMIDKMWVGDDSYEDYIPTETLKAYDLYQKEYAKL